LDGIGALIIRFFCFFSVAQVPTEQQCAEARTALSDGKQYGVKDAAKALKAAGLPLGNVLGK
jgi:hypothetical protein